MSLYKIQDIVEGLLTNIPATRDSDDILYIEYINKVNPTLTKNDLASFLQYRAMYGVPSIESVGRARRKLQAHHPELRGSKGSTEARYKYWKEMREYVKG